MEQDTQPWQTWQTWVVVAALLAVAWWVWKMSRVTPVVPVRPNPPSPPETFPGVSQDLAFKMARAVDPQIPVIMTSGSTVPYGDDEIKDLVQKVLDRLNSMEEYVVLIQVVSASKTLDSYKTVSYDITFNAHDTKENVSMLMTIAALVPVSGKLYVRSFRMFNAPAHKDRGPPAASEVPRGGFAAYEDPVTILEKMKI